MSATADALGRYAWDVVLHSAVGAAIVFAWTRRLGLGSGRSRRRLLVILLVVPLMTPLVLVDAAPTMRAARAWLFAERLLGVAIGGIPVVWIAIVPLAMFLAIQELGFGWARGPHRSREAPKELVERVAALPRLARVSVEVIDEEAIHVSTEGWWRRPRVVVSSGALVRLKPEELDVALRHEAAHWRDGRWATGAALYAVRLAQAWNPVAAWLFREWRNELEILCDEEAVAGGDPRPLAATLLSVYAVTSRRDLAGRALLRRRIDLLLGRLPRETEGELPAASLVAVALVLLGVLPWIV